TRLDPASIELIRSQYPTTKLNDDSLRRMVQNLQRTLALDTVRNRYLLHSRLHQWFAEGKAGSDLASLNDDVYAKLFLTPGSDPWLGLVNPDTYSGLVDDGVVKQ